MGEVRVALADDATAFDRDVPGRSEPGDGVYAAVIEPLPVGLAVPCDANVGGGAKVQREGGGK